MKKKDCGNCKWNEYHVGDDMFCCGNPDSEYYGCENAYDDTCEEYEER